MKKQLLFTIFLITSSLSAQQDMLFSRYMFDGITINPAYAGSHEAFSTTFLVRERWADIQGAPSTMMLSGHSPLGKSMAGGFMIIRDKLGVSERLGFHISGVYRKNLTSPRKTTNQEIKGIKLAFGLQAGTINSRYLFDQLNPKDKFDAILSEGNLNASIFTVGAGSYLYAQNWYVGISAPRISLATFGLGADVAVDDAVQNMLLNAGYVLKINHFLKIKPNFLVRFQKGMIARYDLNMNILLKNRIWLGASYRSKDSVNLLAQLQLTPQLQLAYAYDAYTFSDLNNFTVGSHEFSVNYRLSFFKTKVVEPNLF